MYRFIFILATFSSILMESSCSQWFTWVNGKWLCKKSQQVLQTPDFHKYLQKSREDPLINLSNVIGKQNTTSQIRNSKNRRNILNESLKIVTNPYLALASHIVYKGHFGCLPFSLHHYDEKNGLVLLDRVNTQNMRSVFLPTDLHLKLWKEYKLKIIQYLGSRPSCFIEFEEYKALISEMLKEANNLLQDIFIGRKYKTEKIVYSLDNSNNVKDYNNGTIKIIAYLASDKDKQNGWSGVCEKYSDQSCFGTSYYQPTTRICLYIKVQNGIVITKTVFPVRADFLNDNDGDIIKLDLEGYESNTPEKTLD